MNKRLLKKTLQTIKDDPSAWCQQEWTTCFAAIALRLALGREPSFVNDSPDCVMLTNGRSIAQEARRVLRLSQYHADVLFEAGWSLSDLEQIIEDILGIVTPNPFISNW